jgi:hypothetical protein
VPIRALFVLLVFAASNVSGQSFTLTGAINELRDHTTGLWSSGGTMATTRNGHTATLLPSGEVLVAGGGPGSPTNTAEVWQGATPTGTVAHLRHSHRMRRELEFVQAYAGRQYDRTGKGYAGVLARENCAVR